MCFDSQSVRFVWLLLNKESLVLIFRINFSGSKGMKPRLRHTTSIGRPVSGSGDWLIRLWECKRVVSFLGEKSLHLHVGLMDVHSCDTELKKNKRFLCILMAPCVELLEKVKRKKISFDSIVEVGSTAVAGGSAVWVIFVVPSGVFDQKDVGIETEEQNKELVDK